MQAICLNLKSRDVRKMVVQTRRTTEVQTEQQRIRAEYLELCGPLHATAAEWCALEGHRAALQMRCTHPHVGDGMLPGEYNRMVPANQCPDCGFVAIEMPAAS